GDARLLPLVRLAVGPLPSGGGGLARGGGGGRLRRGRVTVPRRDRHGLPAFGTGDLFFVRRQRLGEFELGRARGASEDHAELSIPGTNLGKRTRSESLLL